MSNSIIVAFFDICWAYFVVLLSINTGPYINRIHLYNTNSVGLPLLNLEKLPIVESFVTLKVSLKTLEATLPSTAMLH